MRSPTPRCASSASSIARPRRILDFLGQRLAPLADLRSVGQALRGEQLGEFWKYRVGDWRVICQIHDATVTILVVRVGSRREVYRDR